MVNKIIISRKFTEKLSSMARPVQKAVTGIYAKLAKNADIGGLNLESIHGASSSSMKSVRVNDNYRVILHQDGKGTFTFLHVDKHDDAYAWAARNKLEVNPFTGELQLYVVDIPEVAVGAKPEETPVYGPFWKKPDDGELLRLGVPKEQIPLVRSLKDDEDLLAHEHDLPTGPFEALMMLYDGKTPDEVVAEQGLGRKPADTGDVAKAVEGNDASQREFVFASSEEELNRIRNAALAQWRIFLHPTQRKIVNKNLNGPMRVLGGAGTGKTVVAMHRVKHLLEKVFVRPEERILFTTYTKNLCEDIRMLLGSICSEEQMKRVDVVNLDKWALDYVRAAKIDVTPLYSIGNDKVNKLIARAIAEVPGADAWAPGFFMRERANVVIPSQVDSLPAYLRVSRAGQGVRLSAQQKRTVWQVLEAYRNILAREKLMDQDEIAILAANQIVSSHAVPYAAVIVDEAQDFSAPALRLVAALSGNSKEMPRPNSLMIVGDAHQRIYGKRAVLSKSGINVIGRSYKLKLNYRTTEKIRKRAVSVLTGVPVDDLDGGKDDNNGFRSLVVGVSPNETRFKTFAKEMEAIVETIAEWKAADGRPYSDYAVLVRRNEDVDAIVSALEERGMNAKKITTDQRLPESARDLVRVATMHRAKGLEFAGVVVAEINEGIWPYRPADYKDMDAVAKKLSDDSERSLLYVALSRAMKHAMITGSGSAPAELRI